MLEPRRDLLAAHIVYEPGNGTRYSLVVTEDPHGGLLVVWPDAGVTWWMSLSRGGAVKRKGGQASKADARAARAAVNLVGAPGEGHWLSRVLQ